MPAFNQRYLEDKGEIVGDARDSPFPCNDPDWDDELLVEGVEDVHIFAETFLGEDGVELSMKGGTRWVSCMRRGVLSAYILNQIEVNIINSTP